MIDLSNDRKAVEIQILGFIRKGQIVPFRVLQHYNHIISIQGGGSSTGGTGGTGGGGGLTEQQTTDAIDGSRQINQLVINTTPEADPTTWTDFSGQATTTSIEILTASTSRKEVIIENKEDENFYITLDDTATTDNSFTVYPGEIFGFDGLDAQKSFNIITESGTVDYYGRWTS